MSTENRWKAIAALFAFSAACHIGALAIQLYKVFG